MTSSGIEMTETYSAGPGIGLTGRGRFGARLAKVWLNSAGLGSAGVSSVS